MKEARRRVQNLSCTSTMGSNIQAETQIQRASMQFSILARILMRISFPDRTNKLDSDKEGS